MDTIAIFDILFLAAIAGFILFRLWSVLGARTGEERPPHERQAERQPTGAPRGAPTPANAEDNVVHLPRPTQNWPAAARKGLEDIAAADRNFAPEAFLQGALAAHENVVQAFAEGNRDELKMLLGAEVYAAFDAAIADREARGLKATSVIVKQNDPQIIWAALKGRSAEVGVRYESEIIQFSKDSTGQLVEGSETVVDRVIDKWTWLRDVKASDPNWKLADTESGD